MSDYTFNSVKKIKTQSGGLRQLDTVIETFCRHLGIESEIESGIENGRAALAILVVTDPFLHQSGLIAPGLQALTTAGYRVTVFSEVQPDPPEAVILAAAELAKAQRIALVIGIGGGSSMDVAKLVACLAHPHSDVTLSNLYGVNTCRAQRLPLLLIPTTAGTGSEVTSIAIVTTGADTKAGVVNDSLLADQVLLDAELTLKLPPAVTAATGVDAMVHAIEAYTSIHRKNPMSDMLAREALRLLSQHIERAVQPGADIQTREAMLLGATLAGQAFENAPVGAVHALAYPLGGIFHIAHGVSNALVLPHVLRFNCAADRSTDYPADCAATASHYAELADIVIPGCAGDTRARCDQFIAYLSALVQTLEIPHRLRDFNIDDTDIDGLAQAAMTQQRLLQNNPRAVSVLDAAAIYRQAF